MPIKGLTQVRRLPRLGKIKMGIKVKTTLGVEYPQKTDYFVVPPEVADVYGDRPKALDIIIPVEDEDYTQKLRALFAAGMAAVPVG
jgi:hypothetical protein